MWYNVITTERDNEGAVVAQVSTDALSPWFAGHFPGDPILPGIAQLHMVTECIAQVVQQKLVLQNLARVKFKKLIRPGDVLDIHAAAGKKENNYTFSIQHNNQQVCSGKLVLAPRKEQ
jgi:3-hydroxyacyl-[acyl-carrier-protein] dehydratase